MAWLLLLALVAVGGTYGILWLTAPTPGFTEENVLRIRRGMTPQQVQNLFGPNVRVRTDRPARGTTLDTWTLDTWRSDTWRGENLLVYVRYEGGYLWNATGLRVESGTVIGAETVIGILPIHLDESFLDRLRRMLRL